jgi:hypothetical protein
MLRWNRQLLCAAAAAGGGGASAFRTLDSATLLEVVQNDSGETARYYALRYFGPKKERAIDLLLWSDLKKYGHVDLSRGEAMDGPARWYPVVHAGAMYRKPRVRRYNAADNDLSLLKMTDDMQRQQENAVIAHLHGDAPIEIPAGRGIGMPAPPPKPEARAVRRSRWSMDLKQLANAPKEPLPVGMIGKSPDAGWAK